MNRNFAFPSDHFAAFAFSSADILLEVDAEESILFADGATVGLLGRNTKELVGKKLKDVVAGSQHNRIGNILNSLRNLHRIDAVSLKINHASAADPVPFRLSGVHMDHKGGRYYLSLRAESQMQSPRDLDVHDPASGLLEKETFAIRSSEHILAAQRKGQEVAITMLDFPGLKEILDALTPKQSQQLMGSIGSYLKSKAVHEDAAGMIERDSYSIITPAALNKDSLVKDIKQIASNEVKGLDLKINITSVSTKSEEYPLSEQDTANAVLYTLNQFAKQRSNGFTIRSLNESYEELLDKTLENISAFRQTLTDDAFTLAFQPIVNIRSGIVHHHECLVRLHNSKQFKNPFEFICFGEQSGIINEFDFAVTQKVIEIIRQEQKYGRNVRLAINLSGRSLSSNLFMDSFLSLMRDNNDLREDILVEITESFKIEQMQMANDFIQTLREEGNPVCLDDFGSGESSFDYLRHLQVDFVKIDGSYVRDSMKTPRGRKLLKAMAGLCRSLDMQMIGEMVETDKEAEFLLECGVQYGQGYYFGKPDTDMKILETHGKFTHHYSGMFNARKFKQDDSDEANGHFREDWMVSV